MLVMLMGLEGDLDHAKDLIGLISVLIGIASCVALLNTLLKEPFFKFHILKKIRCQLYSVLFLKACLKIVFTYKM